MNLSRAISHIKMQLGLNNIVLPFKDDVTGEPASIENVIKDVLKTMTLPIYSQYVPWVREGDGDIAKMKVIDARKFIYELPSYLTITPVMYIIDIYMPYMNTRGTFGDISPSYGINRSVSGVLTSQAYMMLAGQMRSEPSFDYLGENKVRLFGYPKTRVTFKLACEHEPNGETIPASCYQSFMQLAVLDVKEFLYNNLKHWDKLPSAFGTVDLKIEEWQSATSDKAALLDKWEDTFHLDIDNWKFM